MSTARHNALQVMCPFCDEETLFKRSSPELQNHCLKYHRYRVEELNLNDDFFREANGYWLATHPRDYRELIKVNRYNGANATLARDLVKKIIRRRDGSNKEEAMRHWESGWKVVRSKEEEEEAESQFVSVYDDCSPPPTKKKRTDYDPEEPSSEIVMKVQSIQVGREVVALLCADGDPILWYQVTISDTIIKDPKEFASLMRRVDKTDKHDLLPEQFRTCKDEKKKLKAAISAVLHISDKYVGKIKYGTVKKFELKEKSRKPKQKGNETATTIVTTADVHLEPPTPKRNLQTKSAPTESSAGSSTLISDDPSGTAATEPSAESSSQSSAGPVPQPSAEVAETAVETPAEETAQMSTDSTADPVQLQNVNTPEGPTDQQATETVVEQLESAPQQTSGEPTTKPPTCDMSNAEETAQKSLPSTAEPAPPLNQSAAESQEERTAETPSQLTVVLQSAAQQPPPLQTQETLDTSVTGLPQPSSMPLTLPSSMSEVPAMRSPTPVGSFRPLFASSPSVSACSSRSVSPANSVRAMTLPLISSSSLNVIRQQAVTSVSSNVSGILARGGMPLFPPARRNWEKTVTFAYAGKTLEWPPQNWIRMTPDQKLLNWEYAAMSLEQASGMSSVLDRGDLLDKYNFLALPGTKFPPLDSPLRKARYYVYETMRRSTNSTCTRNFIAQVKAAMSTRDTSVDGFIKTVNDSGVSLRL